MILSGLKAYSDQTRRLLQYKGVDYFRSELIPTYPGMVPIPDAYCIEMSPGMVFEPHFHRSNEFQLVIGGSGFIGPHPVKPGSVHYAGHYTPYGPLTAGTEGMTYLTIRTEVEKGFFVLPQHKSLIPVGPKTNRLVHTGIEEFSRFFTGANTDYLVHPDWDGMYIGIARVEPFAPFKGTFHNVKGGQFYIVRNGSLFVPGQHLQKWELVYITPDEGRLMAQAGQDGADIIVLQFPDKLV